MRNEWDGIGIMSGTSLDGIDLAWCHFVRKEDGGWHYHVQKAITVPYEDRFRQRLADAPHLSALEYVKLNNDVADVFAKAVNEWLGDGPRPDFLASHGHTVFHQPQIGLTTQIGNGAVLAAKTNISAPKTWLWVDKGHRWSRSATSCFLDHTMPASTSEDFPIFRIVLKTSVLLTIFRLVIWHSTS